MNRKIITFGSVFAVSIIVLVSFNSIVASQTPEGKVLPLLSIRDKESIQEVKNEFENLASSNANVPWHPGDIINFWIYVVRKITDDLVHGRWEPGYFIMWVLDISLLTIVYLWSLLQGGGPE